MKTLFWNVDTQIDFIEPSGKLYVTGADMIKEQLSKITILAKEKNITVVNTADFHHASSAELSSNPDFRVTFPPHCMAGTPGAAFIDETNPENPIIIDWDKDYEEVFLKSEIKKSRNIVIRKDAFDVFIGNRNANNILQIINPKIVFVYGVTTNVCVNDAVVGLAGRGRNVFVVTDCIKELPNLPLPFKNWENLGIQMIQLSELEKRLG